MGHALRSSLAIPRSSSITELATPALNMLWGDRLPFVSPRERPLRELDRQELYARICVRDPYFALQDVMEGGLGEVTARVPVEVNPDAEASPISAAEVGRHLAILGSCAVSRVNPNDGQHYYLARRARVERLHDGPLPRAPGLLWGQAKAEFKERRVASARTLLSSAEGQPLFSMNVDFNVLSAAAFHRLFQGARQELRREPRSAREPRDAGPVDFAALRQNPHRNPPPLRDLVREGECLRATLGPVSAELCKGHFALHPVLPVAVVMSGLSGLAGTLLRQWLGNDSARYLVTAGDVRAESLAYAGETVRFDAQRLGGQGREHRFDCWASVGSRVVGTMELTLTTLD